MDLDLDKGGTVYVPLWIQPPRYETRDSPPSPNCNFPNRRRRRRISFFLEATLSRSFFFFSFNTPIDQLNWKRNGTRIFQTISRLVGRFHGNRFETRDEKQKPKPVRRDSSPVIRLPLSSPEPINCHCHDEKKRERERERREKNKIPYRIRQLFATST